MGAIGAVNLNSSAVTVFLTPNSWSYENGALMGVLGFPLSLVTHEGLLYVLDTSTHILIWNLTDAQLVAVSDPTGGDSMMTDEFHGHLILVGNSTTGTVTLKFNANADILEATSTSSSSPASGVVIGYSSGWTSLGDDLSTAG